MHIHLLHPRPPHHTTTTHTHTLHWRSECARSQQTTHRQNENCLSNKIVPRTPWSWIRFRHAQDSGGRLAWSPPRPCSNSDRNVVVLTRRWASKCRRSHNKCTNIILKLRLVRIMDGKKNKKEEKIRHTEVGLELCHGHPETTFLDKVFDREAGFYKCFHTEAVCLCCCVCASVWRACPGHHCFVLRPFSHTLSALRIVFFVVQCDCVLIGAAWVCVVLG